MEMTFLDMMNMHHYYFVSGLTMLVCLLFILFMLLYYIRSLYTFVINRRLLSSENIEKDQIPKLKSRHVKQMMKDFFELRKNCTGNDPKFVFGIEKLKLKLERIFDSRIRKIICATLLLGIFGFISSFLEFTRYLVNIFHGLVVTEGRIEFLLLEEIIINLVPFILSLLSIILLLFIIFHLKKYKLFLKHSLYEILYKSYNMKNGGIRLWGNIR